MFLLDNARMRAVVCMALAAPGLGLMPSPRSGALVRPASFGARSRVAIHSESDGRGVSSFDGGGVPSDSSTDDAELAAAAAAGELSSEETAPPSWGPSTVLPSDLPALKTKLLAMAAATARGEAASPSEKDEVRDLVFALESAMDPAAASYERDMLGTWELVFSDTQLFRSSPFFMAGRAVCKDGQEADQYDWFCDQHRAALSMSQIKRVRQVVSETQLVSEFEVSAGTVPFIESVPIPFGGIKYSGGLPLAITGAIVSSADIVEKMDDMSIKLLMDTVEIKGSNIPGLRNLLDTVVRLESRALGNALEQNIDSYENPTPIFRTSYLDSDTRVSRDQDGKIFVYSKTSSSMVPTDYSDTAADFGLGDIVSGLTRAFL